MKKSFLILYHLAAFVIITGCQTNKEFKISGQIDYIGSADIYVSQQPVHYKYAPKKKYPLTVDDKGKFTLRIPTHSTEIIDLHINDQSYPIVAQPAQSITLNIPFAHFPDSVSVSGYKEPWDEHYSTFRQEIAPIEKKIDSQLPAFKEGKQTTIPALYRQRYQIAHKHFNDTPLQDLYYKAVGEYLVKQLEQIKHLRKTQAAINPERRRKEIINEAKKLSFFTFESIHAQRAGIRDFTNAYANTFGVAERLEKEYGQDLMKYDIKRLGYQTLDSARTSILDHIKQRKAKAYAKMYLIAERIGEMPLNVASPSYQNYLTEYADFPRYTSFLKNFYQEIKNVSPGQPAVPFELPNKDQELVQLKDYKDRYVLLDFWASWCIPCLDEFPHMKELYQKYNRDQFEILAISIEKDSLRWRQAINRFQNPWPQLYGGNGFQQETFQAYRGGGIPFYILVGPDGNIVRYNDARPSFNLPNLLDSLITQPK